MKLLLDAGNSRLKWAAVETGGPPVTGIVRPDDEGIEELGVQVGCIGTPERVALVNVRGDAFAARIRAVCLQQRWPEPERVGARRGDHGIRVLYDPPDSLGEDRYVGLVAARHLFSGPLLVVDCGTAVTIDALDADGVHLGGLIFPGLSLMRAALAAGTRALPEVQHSTKILLARDTETAVASGTALGLAAAVTGLCERIAKALGAEPVRVLTGGDASLLMDHDKPGFAWRPWLILQGAYFIMEGGRCDPWRSS